MVNRHELIIIHLNVCVIQKNVFIYFYQFQKQAVRIQVHVNKMIDYVSKIWSVVLAIVVDFLRSRNTVKRL